MNFKSVKFLKEHKTLGFGLNFNIIYDFYFPC